MLINRYSDFRVLQDAQKHAVAKVQLSDAKVTSINMNGGSVATAELRFEFWHLLVEHLFCHPRFGYLNLPEPNPIRHRLNEMGICDKFVEAVYERLSTAGTASLALLVWSFRPSVWRRLTTHCDLRFLPGNRNGETI